MNHPVSSERHSRLWRICEKCACTTPPPHYPPGMVSFHALILHRYEYQIYEPASHASTFTVNRKQELPFRYDLPVARHAHTMLNVSEGKQDMKPKKKNAFPALKIRQSHLKGLEYHNSFTMSAVWHYTFKDDFCCCCNENDTLL